MGRYYRPAGSGWFQAGVGLSAGCSGILMRLGVGSGWYLSFERGIQCAPATEMHGHLLWGELVPQLLNEGAGQRPGSGKAGKGKEGAAWHRKAVCVASVFAELSPGGDWLTL